MVIVLLVPVCQQSTLVNDMRTTSTRTNRPPLHHQDYVKLATWEDRNFASMRVSIDKAQRQLHRLTRKATAALDAPAAAVLAGAAQKLGFDDLPVQTAHEDAAGDGWGDHGKVLDVSFFFLSKCRPWPFRVWSTHPLCSTTVC